MITEEVNNLIEKGKRSVSKEQAETHIRNAEEFLAQTIEYMKVLK
jgi:hypothetical protein